jgi:hypothetical protein
MTTSLLDVNKNRMVSGRKMLTDKKIILDVYFCQPEREIDSPENIFA